jgi:hypothetical protein
MDSEKASYRQYVAGQLRLWEGKIARLNADLPMLEGSERQEYEARLYELQRCNRTVFVLFGNFLLASDTQWEMKRQELETAICCMQQMLDAFTLQPAWSGVGTLEPSH